MYEWGFHPKLEWRFRRYLGRHLLVDASGGYGTVMIRIKME
jgi:hypothetical protein